MPYKEEMSWDASKKRWHRMHGGKMYRVTASKLAEDKSLPMVVERTRDGTREAANEWWRRHITALEGDRMRVKLLHDYACYGDDLDTEIRRLEDLRDQKRAVVESVLAETMIMDEEGLGFTLNLRDIACNPEVDRLAKIGQPAPASSERSVGANVESFLEILKAKAKALTYREVRQFLKSLATELGEETDVGVFDEFAVMKAYLKLSKAKLSEGAKKKRLGFYRRFVEHLAEMKLIESPRNLKSKKYTFTVPTRAVKVYKTSDVRAVLTRLTDRQRLYALLGLNCGMTSADIGQLNKDMIADGILTRKRVKTAKFDDVPTVKYPLWPETIDLLRRCRSDHPTLMLTGKTGEALWTSRIEADGRTPQKDMINQQWKRAKVAIPLKAFRSIAATMLESHRYYGRYVAHFLGHSPKSVKDKNYAAPSDELFAEIMGWLREQLIGEILLVEKANQPDVTA